MGTVQMILPGSSLAYMVSVRVRGRMLWQVKRYDTSVVVPVRKISTAQAIVFDTRVFKS